MKIFTTQLQLSLQMTKWKCEKRKIWKKVNLNLSKFDTLVACVVEDVAGGTSPPCVLKVFEVADFDGFLEHYFNLTNFVDFIDRY